MSDAAQKQPPRIVPYGKFLLLERRAIGGMAEVYLAKAFEGGAASELMAVKRILPSLAEDTEFIRMFLDEAKIAGQLVHPGIVKIRELGRVGGSHYLAMDFVWGKDLLHVIRRCRLLGTQISPSFAAWVGASMCEALHYAHEKTDRHEQPMNLVHRDVSPQNVLVSFDGRVKLIDFGIAKATSRSTRTQAGVLKGKVGYMSPEQVRGSKIDRRSDLFAVGTCLYELLTLRSLFTRENNLEALENVRNANVAPLRSARPDVPEELARIIHKALTKEPEDRWQTARDMQYALLHFINLEDPGYDRVSAVAWLRDAFRKELREERVRLDALDQIGRPQVLAADSMRVTSVTDLEIPVPLTSSPAPELDDDDDEATMVGETPVSLLEGVPDPTPSEIFWAGPKKSAKDAQDAVETERRPATPASEPPPPHEDEAPAVPVQGDVVLSPAQIDSGMIRQLLPPSPVKQTDLTTRRQRPLRNDSIAPPPEPKGSTAFVRVLLALVLLAAGAVAAYAFTLMDAEGRIDVRTVPAVRAAVLLDGSPRGVTPLTIDEVPPGPHTVTVVAPGYRDASREIELVSRGTVLVELALEPTGDPP